MAPTQKLLKTVTVFLADGTSYKTSVNGACSDAEIQRYFVGQILNVGNADKDDCQRCLRVEIRPSQTFEEPLKKAA